MQTKSVLIQSLCVPCFNRCRYCLLSWNGAVEGAEWNRSIRTAERFLYELREQKPEINSQFSFGYSMDHPHLKEAIRTLRRLGSPTASFLQCDGMKIRSDPECRELMGMLHAEGVEKLNFTVYGLPIYHDWFAGRKGDFDLIIRMMRSAVNAELPFSTGIPLTTENISQIDALIGMIKDAGSERIHLFIPHEEGRGMLINKIRVCRKDLTTLSLENRKLLNEEIYRTEADWLKEAEPVQEQNRHILISLRRDNMEDYEKRSAMSVLQEIEERDVSYYAAYPSFRELADLYGNPEGEKLYRIRDLFFHYRTLFARDHDLHIYDVTDETCSGSRRY